MPVDVNIPDESKPSLPARIVEFHVATMTDGRARRDPG
jgi:hypothetical protein